MELKRKSFQGVSNIIRFNWHFYVGAGLLLIILLFSNQFLPEIIQPFTYVLSYIAVLTILISLIVSYYVYDISDLYDLNWLSDINNKTVLNINAGFDETSSIIKSKFPNSNLTICDFYNPEKHTEVSIKRARNAYPPMVNTIQVATDVLPFQNDSFEFTLAILSAHEIRNQNERIEFFKELNRITTGRIYVTEHLRDRNNFFAYTIGFFHFHSRKSWLQTFKNAHLTVQKEIKTTPFITTFILARNGFTL